MILIDKDGEMKTLTNHQICEIKKVIAVIEKRLVIDINDQEVWDFVKEKYLENTQIGWHNAAMNCMDDWGVADMLGYC